MRGEDEKGGDSPSFYLTHGLSVPVPVAARSKALVCSRSPAACCKCCVLSGRGLCDELITRPEESYRLCWSTGGCRTKNKQIGLYPSGLFWPMSTSHVCSEVHRVIVAGNIKMRGI
jgi:hypothetical protein